MTSANVGLAIYLLCVGLIDAGLVLDAVLKLLDRWTITHYVWADGWLGAPILALHAAAPLALAMHFYGRK